MISNQKCNSCGALIAIGDTFCLKCGKQITTNQGNIKLQQNIASSSQVVVYAEPTVAFASGLPDWNIEPPAVVVRRKARI